ncbi:MAG: GNAT family N-acetyltransferase, partial [Clostridia bacterium]
DYRDKGIGREVIAKIVEMSKDFGYKTIVLEARASNVRAIHLYESIGFVKYNVIVGGYQAKRGVEPEDVVEMSMALE